MRKDGLDVFSACAWFDEQAVEDGDHDLLFDVEGLFLDEQVKGIDYRSFKAVLYGGHAFIHIA